MVLIRAESIQFTTNGFLGKSINEFQDRSIKKQKNIWTLERKNKKIQNNKDSILFYLT